MELVRPQSSLFFWPAASSPMHRDTGFINSFTILASCLALSAGVCCLPYKTEILETKDHPPMSKVRDKGRG